MTGKEFLIKSLVPLVLPQLHPLELKAIEQLQKIELQENEKEVIAVLQVIENEIYAFLFAVNESFELVRQITVDNKKSFKVKDLISKSVSNF